MHASQVNDAVTLMLPKCGLNIRVRVRPADSRYTRPEVGCTEQLTAEVLYVEYAQLIWSETDGSALVDYATFLFPVFDAIAAATGDENALALRNALDSDDTAAIADLARTAGDAEHSDELALGYRLMALDAKFRALGKIPSDGLIYVAQDLGTPVLTRQGDELLASVDVNWLPPVPVEGPSVRSPDVIFGTGRYSRFVSVGNLEGLDVLDSEGNPVGEINGFAADEAGGAVVEVGGFLGLGSRTVSVSLDRLRLDETGITFLDFSEIGVASLPESDRPLLSADAEVEFRYDF